MIPHDCCGEELQIGDQVHLVADASKGFSGEIVAINSEGYLHVDIGGLQKIGKFPHNVKRLTPAHLRLDRGL